MKQKQSFTMEIAGCAGRVLPLFESTRDYCRGYLTEREPDFSIAVTATDLAFEQAELDKEALEEGFRLRRFTDPFLERQAIQRAFAEHLLCHNTLMLHGSALALDGCGYLFTAKSGTGKSTHTRLWREVFGSRAVMINDDKPFLRPTEQGFLLCGAPWSGKHGLDSNIAVPLKGICILERGSENRIAPISPAEALPMLLHQSYTPLSPDGRAQYQHLICSLAEQVPLWRLACTKDPQAAILAHSAMSQIK